MTIDELKQYLDSYRLLDGHINSLIEEKDRWKDRALRCTVSMHDGGSKSTVHNDIISYSVEKMIMLEKEIDREIDRLVDMRQDIQKMLDSISDERIKQLLYRKYILGQTLEQIGENMYLCTKQVGRDHRKALQMLVDLYS